MNTKPTGPVSRRLAKQIAAQMKKRGWSPTQAATEAGLPHDAFRSILRGHKPNIDRAEEVCKALGITMVIGIERPTNTESANMSEKIETDPNLSRTAVRYRRDETGSNPWCWDIVQVSADNSERTIGTYTIDELGPELQTIQENDKTSEPDETGDLPDWEQVVERAWLQRIEATIKSCSKAAEPAMPLLRPTEDDRCATKRRLADLIDATDGYVTWCRD